MPGTELKIGPFSGGINTYQDPTAIADNELTECINFDVDLDGSLRTRPPWSTIMNRTLTVSNQATKSFANILGTFSWQNNRFIVYQWIHSDTSLNTKVSLYWLDGVNAGTSTDLTVAQGGYIKAIRFNDILYFIPDSGNANGGASYNLSTSTVTLIATMPGGNGAVVYKSSLFITGGRSGSVRSRVFFSALADFTSWPSSNFFDINPGDGDGTQDLVIYQDNILIFKDTNTYILAYDSQPAQAVLRVVSTTVGVRGPYCVQTYENSIFVLNYNKVYEINNFDFTLVNTKVPFPLDTTVDNPYGFLTATFKYPVFMSLMGDRLFVRFYNTTYFYHLRVRSWTKFTSADPVLKYIGPVVSVNDVTQSSVRGSNIYVASGALTVTQDSSGESNPIGVGGNWREYMKLFIMKDMYDGTTTENGVDIVSTFTTKLFDMGIGSRFKKLLNWGVDMVSARSVTGKLSPVSIGYQTTWAQIQLYRWSDLKTWDTPLYDSQATVQPQPPGSTIYRKFIRFPKSIRFRQLQFIVTTATVGNTTDGPAIVYSLTAIVSEKQLVPKAVN